MVIFLCAPYAFGLACLGTKLFTERTLSRTLSCSSETSQPPLSLPQPSTQPTMTLPRLAPHGTAAVLLSSQESRDLFQRWLH